MNKYTSMSSVTDGTTVHDRWRRKRKLTTIAFGVQNVLLGWDYGLVFINLWIYIEKVVKADRPKICYSVILVSYIMCAFVSSIYLCKLADQYRNIRTLFFVSNVALILGNIVYMFPYSPWILLIGRIITGAGLSQRSIISGELARCYPPEQLTSRFAIMGMANSFGFVMAPAVNMLFHSIDLWLGSWHITYVNISGVYMSLVFALAQCMCFLTIFDLSKEFDLKYITEHKKRQKGHASKLTISNSLEDHSTHMSIDEVEQQLEPNMNIYIKSHHTIIKTAPTSLNEKTYLLPEERKLKVSWILKELLTHADTGILLSLGFLESFLIMSFNMCLPILVIDFLKWSVTSFDAIFLATGLICVLPCLVLMLKTFSDPTVFYISVGSIFGYALLQLIEILFTLYNQNFAFNIALCVFYCVFYANSMIIKDVLLGGFLAKMVCSQYQALSDSIRLAFSRLGDIAALMTAPYALQRIDVVGSVYITVILFFVFILMLRKGTLKNPVIIITNG